MGARWGAVAALSAALVAFVGAPAFAEDPVQLGGAYVLDTVGAISGDEAEVQDALDSLYDAARIQLFVVFVDSFSSPSDPVDWADTTASDNGLGTNDLLLAVAVEDRQYAISIDPAFTLSDSQIDTVEDAIEAQLVDSDWSGAVIAGAQSLEAEATGVVGPGPQLPGDEGDPVESSGGIPVLPIVGGVAVVGVGVFVFSRIRRNRAAGASSAADPDRLSQKELDQRAGTLLVQLDDSLKTSEQELGFAVAQFGDDATGDFTATLASARAKVAQAFALRQQLDDATPDSTADKRAWTIQIIQLCESADAELDAQADAFDALRELEKNAPAALVAVRAQATTAAARRQEAADDLASLVSTYSETAVKPVAGNLEQADKLLVFAQAAATKADEALAAGTASAAAIAVRTAQASVGQVNQLFDGIHQLGTNLGEASEKLRAVIADTTQDVAEARGLQSDPALTPAITAAEAALASVASAKGDPITGLAAVGQANIALEKVFTGVRDKQQAVARASSQLDATLAGARAQVASATEYITTRRGGVGSLARTRVSEAERHLALAAGLAVSDPVAALAEARQATSMAANALESARGDVDGYQYPQQTDYGSDGADLGGIFGDWLFGGGGGGSSSSGGGWFSGGGSSSGSSYRSSRSSRSGSFGGSSRSSSRSSSGGGGRSRGGRF